MDDGKDLQILKTNLQPSFWRKLRKILRQNKKVALLEFLFETTETKLDIEEKIQILETQVSLLQQKLMNLEVKLENPEYALSGTLQTPDDRKIIQQVETLEGKKAPYLPENDPKRSAVLSEIRDSTSGGKDIESKTVSEEKITPVKPFSGSQQ